MMSYTDIDLFNLTIGFNFKIDNFIIFTFIKIVLNLGLQNYLELFYV